VNQAKAPSADKPGAVDDDAHCRREAERLRHEHPGWVVLWLPLIQQYRAYRLSQARRETTLTAPLPGDLAAQISQAERARPDR
jgi:hypothetical protein